jgi:hypothetical protein
MSDETTTVAPAEQVEPKKPKKPAGRSFQLKAGGANRVSLGASPRVSIAAGETFTTTDDRLARRLAAHTQLEETT